MADLPVTDLRQNVLTLAIPLKWLPAVGAAMRQALPAEDYDPGFRGQYLETTYFDTADWKLRKARAKKDKYFVLRIRCYQPLAGPGQDPDEEKYALSIKTEQGKFREEVDSELAEELIRKGIDLPKHFPDLPEDFLDRWADITDSADLAAVVTISMARFAVESSTDRLTLDVSIKTTSGKRLPHGVLEVKSLRKPYKPPDWITDWRFDPLKMSKFLWATSRGES